MTGYYMAEGVESMPSVDCARERDALPVFHGAAKERKEKGRNGRENAQRLLPN